MVSTLNVAAGALSALLFWTCVGAAIARRLTGGPLALPMAPVIGWAVHSALALPLFGIIGFSPVSVLGVAVLAIAVSVASARRPAPAEAADPGLANPGLANPGLADPGARVPWLAFAAAALLALAPALALMPKEVGDGIVLAGPIFDHSKIAMVDEMARLGVPPGNPFFGEDAARLVYYYLLHFSAAELAVADGISGWEADIAMTWVTAFTSLALMMGLAVRFAGRASAAFWVVPLALSASLRPVLRMIWGADRLDAVLLPDTGFAGWMFQSAWVPQHLMSATCVVATVVLMSRLGERGTLRVVVVALLAAAGFESSTWVGGVTFAIAAPLIGVALLWLANPDERLRLLAHLVIAAILTLGIAAPILHDQLAMAALHEVGAPVALHRHDVLGDAFPDGLRRILDLPAFWLVLLPVELPAICIAGVVVLAMLLARPGRYRAAGRDALPLALLAVAGLAVTWLLASMLGDNNDLGWRAGLPAIAVLTVFAAVGLSRWIAARAWLAVAVAIAAIAVGLPRSVEIVRDNVTGRFQPDGKIFAQAPEMWAAVRRHSIVDERVGNNPRFLRDLTPWPANISWALLANRRSCYAGPEFTLIFTALPAARREEIDALFVRVFAGEGSPDDVRELATNYGCRAIALSVADGAWSRDPFASSPFYRLVESKPDRWRVYRMIAPGDGGYRP